MKALVFVCGLVLTLMAMILWGDLTTRRPEIPGWTGVLILLAGSVATGVLSNPKDFK